MGSNNQESREFSIILVRKLSHGLASHCGAEDLRLSRNSLLMIFIDGLGIGPGGSGVNPFTAFQPRVLKLRTDALGPFPRKGICIPTDALLGVPGLPQSATGQTTLFTGVNAAQRIGRHLQGFPGPTLRKIISEHSLFRRLREQGFLVTFANAFTPGFFENRPRWVSTTTVMCETAGIQLRDLKNQSLFMDFTNRFLRKKGYDVPSRGPATAARILVDLTKRFDLCLYEYFLTDLEGHRGSFESAAELLRELDAFLKSVIDFLDLDRSSLLIASDHGNVEDMSHGQHTLNPVPTMLWGEIQGVFSPFTRGLQLEQITPLISSFFGNR
jgi:hypothetical protein